MKSELNNFNRTQVPNTVIIDSRPLITKKRPVSQWKQGVFIGSRCATVSFLLIRRKLIYKRDLINISNLLNKNFGGLQYMKC